MEEFNYKFSQNCSILTLNGVSSLVSKLRLLHKTTNQVEFKKHYKFLQEQCISPKNSVASSAMLGLIDLTLEPDQVVPLNIVVKDIMSSIPNVQNMSGIIDLTFYSLFKNNKTYYDIMKNQHPLITVLKKDQSCWPHILCRIEDKFRTEPKSKVLQKLQPFALFVLYDYEQKMDQILQLELLNIYKQYLDNTAKQKIIILNVTHMARSIRYCKILLPDVPQILVYIIQAIYELFKSDRDATEAIWILHQHVSQRLHRDYALEIAMTADCLPIAPITAMDSLCECINMMLSTQKYPTLVTSLVKSSLLCWKMHFATSTMLNEKVSGKIDEVLARQFEHNDSDPPAFEYLDEKPYIYSYILATDFNTELMDALETATPEILEMMFNFMLGQFNDDCETDVTVKVLNLLLKTCRIQTRYTTRMLPVLLHKISNTSQPDLHLQLLRALPQMGVLKENLSTIVMTIKAISEVSAQIHAFALSLMYDLVLTDKICFPYLEELLALNPDSRDIELTVTKAFIIRELCKKLTNIGLDNYRKELGGYISKALVRTVDNDMVIRLSFEALKYLCHGFDPYLTLLSLIQRFEHSEKESIIVGICGIMGEIASVPDISDQKCEEVVKKLFIYTETNPSAKVLEAVYANLSNFTMEQIAVGFPNLYTHITNDNSILGSLAGACWVNLLQFGPRVGLHAAADMLIRFIQQDMKTYKRINYSVSEGHGEPIYMSLPRDNVLAAIAKFVKKNVTKLHAIDKESYRECFRILSTKYIRPLPPMDWSFLSELKDEKELQTYIITLGARQSGISGSARRFTENYIKSLTERNVLNEEVLVVYSNLDILCNTIQPVILKPFFKKTLKLGIFLMESSHKEIDFILEKLQVMLKNPNASESNKTAATEVLLAMYASVELETEMSDKLLPVIGYVPKPHLNDFSPVHFETINDMIMLRCLSIHCTTAAADEENPFSVLDGIVDCRILKTCVQPAFNFDKMYSRLAPVFAKHRGHKTFPLWLNELISKINIELAERKDMKNVIFSCSVFIIAVVVSSGFNIFAADVSSLEELAVSFPFGLGRLLHSPPFSPYVSQILESLYDFVTNSAYKRNVMSENIAQRFKHGLLLMRSHDSFNDKFSWMKYVEVNF